MAISNRRLVKCEPGPDGLGRVTFTYRKSGSRRWRTMTVTADEFIRRFLQHALPSGFQKVRHYGFAHPCKGIDLEWPKMLVTTTLAMIGSGLDDQQHERLSFLWVVLGQSAH